MSSFESEVGTISLEQESLLDQIQPPPNDQIPDLDQLTENQSIDDDQSIETAVLHQPLEATMQSESINQFVDQSFIQTAEFTPMMDQTISQSMNHFPDPNDEPDTDSVSLNQPNDRFDQPNKQSFDQSMDFSVNLADTMPSNNQAINQPSSRSNIQSTRQSSRQAELEQTVEQTIDQLLAQSSNESNDESIEQSMAEFDLAPLPSFASDEVRSIDKSIQTKKAKLQSVSQSINQLNQRISVMSAHLVHVQREYQHTVNLSNEQSRSIEQSAHMNQVNDRSIGKLQQQCQTIKQSIKQSTDLLNQYEQKRLALADEIEAHQTKLQVSNEKLLQWSLTSKTLLNDRDTLFQYSKNDSALLNERRQQYQEALSAQREAQSIREQQTTRANELLATAKNTQHEYAGAQETKLKLIEQWQQAVRSMHSKDEQLIAVSEQIIDIREQTEEQKAKNDELNAFLGHEQVNNKKLTASIDELERNNGKQRDAFKFAKESIIGLEDSVLNKRAVLEKLESDLRASKQAYQAKQQRRDQQLKRRDAAKKVLATRTAELEAEEAALKSVTNQHAMLSEKLTVAQEEDTKMAKQVTQAKNSLFQLNEKLSKERTRESQLIAQISNAVNTSRMLQGKIRQLDQRSLKQQETLYQIEYLIQGLERKRAVESGVKSEEEHELLTAELRELEQKLEDENKEMTLIKRSIARVNDEHRLLIRTQEKLKSARANLVNATSELSVRIGAMERELQSTTSEWSALNVVHDRTKLELNAVSARLYDAQGELQKAELAAVELDLSMKERLSVIKQHTDLKNMELKQANQMRQLHVSELTERKRALKLLETKYRAIRAKFVGSEGLGSIDEEDEQNDPRQSQGYYIVQAGLKREELCIEREKLQAELTNLEQQIEGVTRVTLEMQAMNQPTNKQDNANVGDLAAQLSEVQAKAANIDGQLASARTRQSHTSRELEQSKHVLAQLINEVAQSTSQIHSYEKRATELDKAQANQIAALKRARQTANKRANETQNAFVEAFTNVLNESRRDRMPEEEKMVVETPTRSKKSKPGTAAQPNSEAERLAKEEMELIMTQLRVAETRRRNAVWKELLSQYADEHPEIGPTLADLCAAASVKLEWSDTRPASSVSSIVSADLTARSNLSTASSTSSTSTFNVSFPPINPNSRPGSNSVSGRSTGRISAR